MSKNSYNVSIKERISPGNYWTHPIKVKNLQDLIEELKKEKVTKFSLKHSSQYVDYEIDRKINISIDELNEDDFKYLTEDKQGYFMFIFVEHKKKD
ncbi:MAG: hypothetical protein K9N07_11770 [Candidatus Cloacimonetes bacterium]|nr:hypothetical protein [Candidatus Cloacimonadota bacterium]